MPRDIQIKLNDIAEEFQTLNDDRSRLERRIECLEDKLDDKDEELIRQKEENNEPLYTIATQLGIIAVPHMSRWALLLDIERAIENVCHT